MLKIPKKLIEVAKKFQIKTPDMDVWNKTSYPHFTLFFCLFFHADSTKTTDELEKNAEFISLLPEKEALEINYIEYITRFAMFLNGPEIIICEDCGREFEKCETMLWPTKCAICNFTLYSGIKKQDTLKQNKKDDLGNVTFHWYWS